MTFWVRMHKKMSHLVWRREIAGEVFRVPPATADVEVRSQRVHGVQAAEARHLLDIAIRLRLVPRRPKSGAHYRLPLCLTTGCRQCHQRHKEGRCTPST